MNYVSRLRRATLGTLALVVLAAPAHAQRADGAATFATLSDGVAFVENRGQWEDKVLFRADLGGGTAWVTREGVIFDFFAVEREERNPAALPHERPEAVRRGHVVAMRFEGGRARRAVGHGQRAGYHNYFLGSDPARWASRVPRYDEVTLEELYDGVDLRLYEDERGLRYDLVVAPGADASQVRMRMEGAYGVSLTAGGALSVGTALGPVEHRGLLAYQDGGGRREVVPSAFRVTADGVVAFDVRGADPARRLVIDPLIWSTFLGGGGSDHLDAVAVGVDGSATVAGQTYSMDFPVTLGAYDTSLNGIRDATVTRISPDGSDVLYSTFLGGNGEETALDVSVGADGSATVAGYTESDDFPTTPGAYDPSFNGGPSDGFVARLSPDGTALFYSTYLGGTDLDWAHTVAVGPDGSTVVAGLAGSDDFPTTPGAYDTSFNGSFTLGDAFVIRLSPDGDALLYSTFLGGRVDELAFDVAVSPDGSATVAGDTQSADFPTTAGAFDTSYNGNSQYGDGFVARLSPDGSILLWSTYLGGADEDRAEGVAVNVDGSATVGGSTGSVDFPATPGAYDPSFNGHRDVFVTRLTPDGSALEYATFLGGSGFDVAHGVALGADGGATVAGLAVSTDFPTTPGAYDTSHNGFYDAFVARLSPDGTALLYSTYLGGTEYDEARAIAVGADDGATVVGSTWGKGFPVTPGAYDTTHNGLGDAFVAQLDVGLSSPGCPLSFNSAAISPLTVASGGTVTVTVDVANDGSTPRLARLVLRYARDGGGPSGALAIGSGTVPVTSGVSASVSRRVPGNAPGGSYALNLELVDVQSGVVCDTRPFTLTVQGARVAAGDGSAPFEGAAVEGLFGREATVSTVAASDDAAVWPNPASEVAHLAFALAAPSAVRVALYDVLGRAVAAVDAGRLEVGAHRLALDVSSLPVGVYVWRLSAGSHVETGHLTVAR